MQSDRKPRVLVTDQMIRKESIAVIEKDCDVRVIQQYSPEAVAIEAARDVEAVLARDAKITKNVLAAAPRLKIVARHGVGVDSLDLAEAT
jgi:D-3-phosphoglycerate dehydrogenase / 2-oxoglutarate reductase